VRGKKPGRASSGPRDKSGIPLRTKGFLPHNQHVPLVRAAAELMRSAQAGRVDEALSLAAQVPEIAVGASPTEQAGLWYAVAVAHLTARRYTDALLAVDRCLAAALECGDPGWSANALTLRAMAQARLGRVEPALLDLARAEARIGGVDA